MANLYGPINMYKITILFMSLLCAACSSGLKLHARVAETSAQLIDAIALEILIESDEDKKLATMACQSDPDPHMCTQARYDNLRIAYTPILQAYEALRRVHEKYVSELQSAQRQGQNQLDWQYARGMLDKWQRVQLLGDSIGIIIPKPPKELTRAAGGT